MHTHTHSRLCAKVLETRRAYTIKNTTTYNQYLSAFNVVCIPIRHSGRMKHTICYFFFLFTFLAVRIFFVAFSWAHSQQCEETEGEDVFCRPWTQQESLYRLPNLICSYQRFIFCCEMSLKLKLLQRRSANARYSTLHLCERQEKKTISANRSQLLLSGTITKSQILTLGQWWIIRSRWNLTEQRIGDGQTPLRRWGIESSVLALIAAAWNASRCRKMP